MATEHLKVRISVGPAYPVDQDPSPRQVIFKSYLTGKATNLEKTLFSVLQTPTMMSNFQRRRGFMDVNRMLRAPTFNPDRNAQQNPLGQGAGQPMSSTGLIGQGVNIETS